MIAFDTDILTEILVGAPEFVTRASSIPRHEQTVPAVVIEEIIRGRLQVVRQAEAGTARIDLARAYALFEQTIRGLTAQAGQRLDRCLRHVTMQQSLCVKVHVCRLIVSKRY